MSAQTDPHPEALRGDGTGSGTALPPPDPIYTLRPHAGEVTAVEHLSLDSRGLLITGTSSGELSVWDLSTKRQEWKEVCTSPVIAVDATALPGKLISQCRGSTVEIWDLQEKKREGNIPIGNPGFCRLSSLGDCAPAHLPSASFAISASKHGQVNVYNATAKELVTTLSVKEPKSKGMCMCVKIFCSPVNGVVYILGGFEDGSVVMWDYRNKSEELTSLKLFSEPVMCLAYDPAKSCGVCGSPLNTLESFSVSTSLGDVTPRFSVELKNAGVADVDVRHDSRIIASGGWDGRIRVFGWKKGKPLAILNYHTATVNCVSFAGPNSQPEDRNLLVCGSKDERISLWKLY